MSLAPGIYKALRLFGPRDEGRPVPTAPQESTAAAVAGLAESIRRLDLAAAPAEIVNLVSTPVMIENLVSGMEMCDQPAPAGESDAIANAKAPASGENQGANQGAPVGVAVSSRTRSSESERSPANPFHEPGEIEFPNSASPLTRYDTVVVQDDDDDDDDDE